MNTMELTSTIFLIMCALSLEFINFSISVGIIVITIIVSGMIKGFFRSPNNENSNKDFFIPQLSSIFNLSLIWIIIVRYNQYNSAFTSNLHLILSSLLFALVFKIILGSIGSIIGIIIQPKT